MASAQNKSRLASMLDKVDIWESHRTLHATTDRVSMQIQSTLFMISIKVDNCSRGREWEINTIITETFLERNN